MRTSRASGSPLRRRGRWHIDHDLGDRRAKHANVPSPPSIPCLAPKMVNVTYLGLVLFRGRLGVRLVEIQVPLEISEAVDEESVLCIERVPVHRRESSGSIIAVLEFQKDKSKLFCVRQSRRK